MNTRWEQQVSSATLEGDNLGNVNLTSAERHTLVLGVLGIDDRSELRAILLDVSSSFWILEYNSQHDDVRGILNTIQLNSSFTTRSAQFAFEYAVLGSETILVQTEKLEVLCDLTAEARTFGLNISLLASDGSLAIGCDSDGNFSAVPIDTAS